MKQQTFLQALVGPSERRFLKTYFEGIQTHVLNTGGRITIRGFGSFVRRTRKARYSNGFGTTVIDIPARYVVAFIPHPKSKRAL